MEIERNDFYFSIKEIINKISAPHFFTIPSGMLKKPEETSI